MNRNYETQQSQGLRNESRTKKPMGLLCAALAMIGSAGIMKADTPHKPLWDAAAIVIADNGVALSATQARSPLYDAAGRPIQGGSLTIDTSMQSVGVVKFTWEVPGGRLEVKFPFPGNSTTALVPAPRGPSGQYRLLKSSDDILKQVDPTFVAEGVFRDVKRVISKCENVVQFDAAGVPHLVAPVSLKDVYILVVGDED